MIKKKAKNKRKDRQIPRRQKVESDSKAGIQLRLHTLNLSTQPNIYL